MRMVRLANSAFSGQPFGLPLTHGPLASRTMRVWLGKEKSMAIKDYPEYVGDVSGMISGRVYDRREVGGGGYRDPRPFAGNIPNVIEATYVITDEYGYRYFCRYHVTAGEAILVWADADASKILEGYPALVEALHSAIRENVAATFAVVDGQGTHGHVACLTHSRRFCGGWLTGACSGHANACR